MINRLRVTCVSGPWLDDECVRFIDMQDSANLFDLHIAIQDAVMFDDEYPFYFFRALAHTSSPEFIPEGMDPEQEIDTDVYEDIDAMDFIKPGAKKSLFYVFLTDGDDWIFKVQHTGKTHEPVDGEFYPLVLDSLSVGPNPEQYGSGFDDFAENEDHFRPARGRGGADEYNRDDESLEDDMFGFGEEDENDDDEFGFGRDDEDEDYEEDYGADEDDDEW